MLSDTSDSDYDSQNSHHDIAEDDPFVKSAAQEGAYKGEKSPFGLPHKMQPEKLQMSHQNAKKACFPRLQISKGCMARTIHGQVGPVVKVSAHKNVRSKTVTLTINGLPQKCKYSQVYH